MVHVKVLYTIQVEIQVKISNKSFYDYFKVMLCSLITLTEETTRSGHSLMDWMEINQNNWNYYSHSTPQMH